MGIILVGLWSYNRNLQLPPMGADQRFTTISGLAGGAQMADLIQVIYSSDFHGAAMINGGPYNSMHYSDV